MNFETILGKVDFLEFLRGKKATFLLSASVTKTCEIPNISQAGIPGKLYLTPTLDSEFLCTKQVRSMPQIAQTPKGVPTPALITRAVHELNALKRIDLKDEIFDKLASLSDNMIIFNAGFILGSRANNLKVILAGGTQMAAVLLVVNSILRSMDGQIDSSNLALCTTKWINKDENSNIKALLEQLDFPINAYASDFDFSESSHPALKLYDEGEAKEGVGCGGALCYGAINGLTKEQVTKKVESFLV